MTRPDHLLRQSRETLAELRSATAHSQKLIDDLTATIINLESTLGTAPSPLQRPTVMPSAPSAPSVPSLAPGAMPPQFPVPPAPFPPGPYAAPIHPGPPRPVQPSKPRLTTEQKVLRIAAVLGTIITFIGASFGVALAIQSGLLGPVARAILALVFALVLLGVGVAVDTRRGPSPGVTALYTTSLLVIWADLTYVTFAEEWFSLLTMGIVFIVVWTLYLSLAVVRANIGLVICMCISLFFFTIALSIGDPVVAGISMLAPILVLLLTWGALKPISPGLLIGARSSAGLLLAWQTLLAGPMSDWRGDANVLVLIPLASIFTLIAGETFYPVTGVKDDRLPRAALGVLIPALVVLITFGLTEDWALWLPPAACVLAVVFVAFAAKNSNVNLTGWLAFTPFTIFPAASETHDYMPRVPEREAVPIIVFILAFAAVVVLIRYRAVHRVAVLTAWTFVLFCLTFPMTITVLGSRSLYSLNIYELLQGVILALFLGFAASQIGLWRSMNQPLQGLFAGAGLFFGMVATVIITTSLGNVLASGTEIMYGPEPGPNYAQAQGVRLGFLLGHMLVSIMWMTIASGLLLKRADPARSKTMRTAGLILASVATLKLVLFDMASLSGIPRVLTFTVCGLLLIAVAVIGAQRNGREGQPATTSGPAV